MSNSRAASCTPFVVTSPLWQRAPARDENGVPYSDFMMLIPGLKQQNEAGVESCLVKIKQSLSEFEHVVVYVDLNIKLSCLWITHKSIPGITKPLVQAVLREIPYAKVVAMDFNPDTEADNKQHRHWLVSFGFRIKQSFKLIGKSEP